MPFLLMAPTSDCALLETTRVNNVGVDPKSGSSCCCCGGTFHEPSRPRLDS